MKIFKRYLLLLLLLCLIFLSTYAKKNESQSKSPTFIISSLDKKSLPDSIIVFFWKEHISGNLGRQRFIFKQQKNKIIVTLPSIDHISKFYFAFFYNTKSIASNKYYAEPNDQINIIINKDGEKIDLKFTGKKSTKFQVRDIIEKESDELTKKVNLKTNELNKTAYNSHDLKVYLDTLLKLTTKSKDRTYNILSSYSHMIGLNLTKFYTYELDNSDEILTRLSLSFYLKANKQNRRIISDFYFKNKKTKVFDNPWLKYSHAYILNTNFIKLVDAYIQSEGRGFTFKERFDNLKLIENFDLRDGLIVNFFLFPLLQSYITNFADRDSCLKEAYSIVRNSSLKLALKKQFLFTKGNNIYDFSFKDTSGNIITLKDMKGKVFLIEFYGEGCGGCAFFAKRFKEEVYPKFMNNTKFKVLSVNVDRSKERWFKAMNSGLYTQKNHYINLNVGKEGIYHPIFKFYGINALPFVMLVNEEGCLIAKIDSQSSQQIINMIQETLFQDASGVTNNTFKRDLNFR